MKSALVSLVSVLLATCVFALPAEAGEVSGKKLRIFLLAGQSNMTGYCGIMPLTNLANYRELEDPALRGLDERLCKVVFPGEDAIRRNNERRGGIHKLLVETQDARKLLEKAKQDKDAAASEKLEREIKATEARRGQLEAELEVAKGKRVHIAPDGRYGHKPGILTFGYGRGSNYIGPEYGFGLTLEQKLDAPILLVKVAQDGASLAYHYRPPSSGPYVPTEKEQTQREAMLKRQAAGEKVKVPDYSEAGKDYRRLVEFTREVLGDLKSYHPEYDPAVGYEIAGFVWFQGWTDNHMGVKSDEYQRNMANLIRDLRKDLAAPGMLVVSGTPSYDRTQEAYEAHPVVRAQRAVGKMPEFKGNVAIVETLQYYDQQIWPLWPKWKEHYPEWHMAGSHVACHYLGSGRFFVRLGDALSSAMAGMMKQKDSGERR
jgi:alpha-galactosidase